MVSAGAPSGVACLIGPQTCVSVCRIGSRVADLEQHEMRGATARRSGLPVPDVVYRESNPDSTVLGPCRRVRGAHCHWVIWAWPAVR
jgi:hypothetical protein